jgi:hypothetical protein
MDKNEKTTLASNLVPMLQVLRNVSDKKHKRFAKNMEAYLQGSVENPGIIVSLIAGSVALPDTRAIGMQVGKRQVTLSEARGMLLDLWVKLGYITKDELKEREDD